MMNCEHCEKKLSDMYFTDNVKTKHVNEVGQQVIKETKELYFCNYKCSNKYVEHYQVKKKINLVTKCVGSLFHSFHENFIKIEIDFIYFYLYNTKHDELLRILRKETTRIVFH